MSWDHLPSHLENRVSGVISAQDKIRRTIIKKEPTHSEICRSVCKYLSDRNIMFMQNNTGQAKYEGKDGRIRTVNFGSKGSADIFVWLPKIFVALEIKTKSDILFIRRNYSKLKQGQMTMNKRNIHIIEQNNFIENLKSIGHDGGFFNTVREVNEFFSGL